MVDFSYKFNSKMIDLANHPLPHGITLNCRTCGDTGRPVLVFLHGFPEAAFVWDPLLLHFSQPEHGGYRCVAPNLRGYAGSSAPPEVTAYRAKHLVQDIVALIQAEGAPLAALVAHDWGGALAWNLANQHPELLERLIILNSPHPGSFLRELQSSPAQQDASAYMNFLIRPDAAERLAENDYRRLFDFFVRMGADPNSPIDQPPEGAGWLTAELKDRYRTVWQAGLEGALNYYRASPLRPPRPEDPGAAGVTLPDTALRVDCPTLVIWGMDDSALPPSLLDGLERWVPRLTLEQVPGATHWIVHERPAWVAERLGRYLSPCTDGGCANS